jgi:hypothetical protein
VPPAALRFYTVRTPVSGGFRPESKLRYRIKRFMAHYHGVQCGMHAMFRMGRNPATGATVQIAASKKVAFRASKELKAAV